MSVTGLDIETRRALNAAAGGHHTHKRTTPGPVIRWEGRIVHLARAKQPYGRSTHARGYLTHVCGPLYLAWRRGRHVGAMVRWRCGGTTNHFVLLAEPNSPLCPICVALTVRSPIHQGGIPCPCPR
jgi:hypothetical protein